MSNINILDERLDNNKKDIGQFSRDKQRPATLSNFMPQNGPLSKLLSTFREITFSEFKFLTGTSVSNT